MDVKQFIDFGHSSLFDFTAGDNNENPFEDVNYGKKSISKNLKNTKQLKLRNFILEFLMRQITPVEVHLSFRNGFFYESVFESYRLGDLRIFRKENDEEKKLTHEEYKVYNDKCNICDNNYSDKNLVLISKPCWHEICSNCSIKIKKCPVCNADEIKFEPFVSKLREMKFRIFYRLNSMISIWKKGLTIESNQFKDHDGLIISNIITINGQCMACHKGILSKKHQCLVSEVDLVAMSLKQMSKLKQTKFSNKILNFGDEILDGDFLEILGFVNNVTKSSLF